MTDPLTLSRAIQWKWPGAQCIVRGGVLDRWDGPMARPTDPEIAQAVTDYDASAATITADREVDAILTSPLAAALLDLLGTSGVLAPTASDARVFSSHGQPTILRDTTATEELQARLRTHLRQRLTKE